MKTSEALYAAADYIREHGWTRGTFSDNAGRVCMIGAIDRTTARAGHVAACMALANTIGDNIVVFNDYHCESGDDAIAALEIAADIAAAEGK